MNDTFSHDIVKIALDYLNKVKKEIKNMPNFNDYEKENEQAKLDLINKLYVDRDNIDLRIEELKSIKTAFTDYDYLYTMVKLRVLKQHITDIIDLINGWLPEDEENIPADMIFEPEEKEEIVNPDDDVPPIEEPVEETKQSFWDKFKRSKDEQSK